MLRGKKEIELKGFFLFTYYIVYYLTFDSIGPHETEPKERKARCIILYMCMQGCRKTN